jgi:ubiquitin-protein ligase
LLTGVLPQLEISKTALSVASTTETFNFDILLRDKFPFQPPLIMTKTRFSNPSLADGRDLLAHLLPGDQREWRPSMNLYEIIQQIPVFVSSIIEKDKQSD